MPEKLYVDTFHPEALEEMLKIEYFYERKSRLLAKDFYDDVVKPLNSYAYSPKLDNSFTALEFGRRSSNDFRTS